MFRLGRFGQASRPGRNLGSRWRQAGWAPPARCGFLDLVWHRVTSERSAFRSRAVWRGANLSARHGVAECAISRFGVASCNKLLQGVGPIGQIQAPALGAAPRIPLRAWEAPATDSNIVHGWWENTASRRRQGSKCFGWRGMRKAVQFSRLVTVDRPIALSWSGAIIAAVPFRALLRRVRGPDFNCQVRAIP